MILFHGTSESAGKDIMASGIINGPVFLTPSREMAENYGECVIEVEVSEDDLMIDFDLPGQRILDVESANSYTGNCDYDISDYIYNDQSVAVKSSVNLKQD